MTPENLTSQLRQMHELQIGIGQPFTTRGLVLEHGIGRRCRRDRWPGVRRGRERLCFQNATQLAAWTERWVYCEGYAIRSVLPMVLGEHAWVLDSENGYEVVDPTWRDTKDGLYLGIPINPHYLRRQLVANKVYGLLNLDDFKPPPMFGDPPSEWLHPDVGAMPRDF
jgi:hypothetical protein